ncbi:MAG TPA: Calx-beta domain-containing protein [Thermoanaerobaculia bacterium]
MRKITLAVLLLLSSSLGAQSPYLVKDINSTTNASPTSSNPANFFRFGPRIYFSASTPQTGEELWSTDGTAAGTSMVANIMTGSQGSKPSRFSIVNGSLLFAASDSRGEELWITDGTAAGTRLLADINSAGPSSSPGAGVVIGGQLIFPASDGVNGRELWITDGTPAGTRFFKDLIPGPESASPRTFVPFAGAVYFTTDIGLWKTDGTEAGTVLVKSGLEPRVPVAVGSRLFFVGYTPDAGAEPWVSDGTAAGTVRLADIYPGVEGSSFSTAMTPVGDRVVFHAHDPQHGTELWVSDGTAAGTQLLRDIHPGTQSGWAGFGIAGNGTTVLFAATSPETGVEVWRTDGTPAGTTLLRDLNPGPGSTFVQNLTAAGDSIYFVTGGLVITRLWTSDGTPEGTRETATFDPRLNIGGPFTNIDGTLYFGAANRLNGHEPWKSDGTAAGTMMIANIAADSSPSSDPVSLRAAGDWLYFNAWDGAPDFAGNGRESFWRTDGTAEGTVKLAEDSPESVDLLLPDHTMFFRLDHFDLWITDGTPEGTKPATEFERRFPQQPMPRFVLGDTILVGVDQQLWATKLAPGSPAVPLGSENAVTYAQNTPAFAELAGRAFYVSRQSTSGTLWSTDGTPAGTFVVKHFEEGLGGRLAVMGGHVYAITEGSPAKLMRSDGTAEGTVALAEFPGGAAGLHAAESRVYFFAGGGKLWVTDGTAAGTRELPARPSQGYVITLGSSILFHQDPAGGTAELWISDGTIEGTHELHDFGPGVVLSYVSNFVSAGGRAYFNVYTQATGTELWTTDGTSAGTRPVDEIAPGAMGSSPSHLVAAGERLFFGATTAETGRELWALPLSVGPRVTVGDVRVAEAETTARFTVSLSSPATQTVTVAFATSDGTATAGNDYDAASDTLTFAAGESSKTIDVHVHADGAAEHGETFLVTLRDPSGGATIETAVAAGIIEDDDRTADVGLVLDFSDLGTHVVTVDMTNAGPSTASNLQPRVTITPANFEIIEACDRCRLVSLAPAARAEALRRQSSSNFQQYFTATLTARERDPNPANNTVAWTMNGAIAMDALYLVPGGQATVWVGQSGGSTVNVESTNPAVFTAPATLAMPASGEPASFVVHAVGEGSAALRVFTEMQTLGVLVVHVVAPGAKPKWPGAIEMSLNASSLPFHSAAEVRIFTSSTAPFTGATPTGTVTLSANDVQVGQLTLQPGVFRQGKITTYVPKIGENVFRLDYPGDANFEGITTVWAIQVTRGYNTIQTTAVRTGSQVVVRTHLTGSPLAAATGTVRVGDDGAEVPLTAMGPGIAEAEVILDDVPESTTTLTVFYSGDANYFANQQQVRITEGRRRSARH